MVESTRRLRLSCLAGAFLLVAALCTSDQLAAQAPDTLTLPIRVANGHIVVVGDLVGLRYTNEISFEISFEYPDALTLHPDQYQWMGYDPNDVSLTDVPMIHFVVGPGKRLSIPAKDVAAEQNDDRRAFQNMMTRQYSSALAEHKLKGTIGIGLLKKYHVTLDVPAKQLTLAPLGSATDASAANEVADTFARNFEYVGNHVQVDITFADSRAGRLALGGTEYDTTIDTRVAAPLGKPAGDVVPVWLADAATPDRRLDLSRYVAFRPQAFGLSATPSADSPTIIAGWNLLEHFKIDLDWNNQRLTMTSKGTAHYPQQDFEYFKAETSGSADALRAYLTKYPHERLSAEAATQLMKWLVERDKAPDDVVLKALPFAIDTALTGRQTETCYAYLQSFKEMPGRMDLAIATGVEGLKHSREAFDARVVYQLHNALGELYMKKSDWNEAWKHFLSAAFLAPDDLLISLNLGRVYDKQGEVRRAYARYKRVAAAPGLPPEIETELKASMDRLRKELPKDDPLLRDETPPPAGRGRGRGGWH